MVYDVAVIGAGAAGAMAAIRAAGLGRSVVLVERNDAICRKVLITGKGRCNITNSGTIDSFMEKFGAQGQFLRSAFQFFFNEDLIDFFRSQGLEMKTERQGRVFPKTDSSRSVVEVLQKALLGHGVEIMYGRRLKALSRHDGGYRLGFESGDSIDAGKVVLATGGASYAATGSAGDGYTVARSMGHTVTPLRAGLVPLTTGEAWVKDLQGLGLDNIRVRFESGRKRIVSDVGELMFTHFGVSGPLVLDLSADVLRLLESSGTVRLAIDLKPGMSAEDLEKRFLRDFARKGKIQIKNILKDYLPQRLIPVVIALAGVDAGRQGSQVSQQERRSLCAVLKALTLTVSGSLPLEEAMVTGGGVSTKEIDPRTMESRISPGLYFAGEIIDGCASSGGYNLQQAFSTGYLAGTKAAESIAKG